MSYSFSVQAKTKAEAKEKIVQQMATVLQSQPMHAKDAHQATAAAFAFVDTLPDDPNKSISVTVNGYLSWSGDSDAPNITSANFGCSANLVT